MTVKVIGGGLAGCEAAHQLSKAGIKVELYEMKPKKFTPAHTYNGLAELVCSNSLKAMRIESAAGMLKEEMRQFDSLIIKCAEITSVPAGGALAVDRKLFSDKITQIIYDDPNITVINEEISEIPDGYVIVATGPLTSDSLSKGIQKFFGKEEYLSFFDAEAPIINFESLDMSKVFFAARYGRGDDDYINCPFEKEEYDRFYNELINAESAELNEFDKRDFKVYEGCMPIEVLAKRGYDSMRFGPLKPVGLTNPHTGKRPYAVVQLRKENLLGTMYNIVGFQTNLKFPEQKRVFSLIPGLENVEFYRYGVMHRNTFINSPKLLNADFCTKKDKNVYFAGQITGVEGYIESAMSGIIAGYSLAKKIKGEEPVTLPKTSMMGALAAYISDENIVDFQPMGCNMGILPALENKIKDKTQRYLTLAMRGINDLKQVLGKGEE
jgi:methylenetetrahydrofolate--tRNA-(uracil-5-)-methyltransferase